MSNAHELSARERRRRDRRFWSGGLLTSLLFHLLVFVFWRGDVLPLSSSAAAGPRAGDDRAAGGAMQTITIRTPPDVPVPIVPPPVPIPVEIEVEEIEYEDVVQLDPASILGERPGLSEVPGLATGDGRGDGGDAESGLYRMEPASPRGMIIPPSNRDLRGTQVQVWVFVDENGSVVADSTRLDPPTKDGDFNRRLIREAAEWVFRPARQEGRPVASWFPYRISM